MICTPKFETHTNIIKNYLEDVSSSSLVVAGNSERAPLNYLSPIACQGSSECGANNSRITYILGRLSVRSSSCLGRLANQAWESNTKTTRANHSPASAKKAPPGRVNCPLGLFHHNMHVEPSSMIPRLKVVMLPSLRGENLPTGRETSSQQQPGATL